MLIYKRMCALLMAIAMLCVLGFPAYAYPAPDLAGQGSITLYMQYQDAPVPGGSMALYRVGDLQEDGGIFRFVPADDFSGCGLELGEFGSKQSVSSELAAELRKYADKNNLTGTSMQIGSDGKAFFGGLNTGLYLLVQTVSASGYLKASPFLVSLPLPEDGEYLYDITASPKLVKRTPGSSGGGGKDPGPPSPGGPGNSPGEPGGSPGGPSDSTGGELFPVDNPMISLQALPQTGQLNWPVPVLALLGLGMFIIGWMLRYGRKRQDET